MLPDRVAVLHGERGLTSCNNWTAQKEQYPQKTIGWTICTDLMELTIVYTEENNFYGDEGDIRIMRE